MPARADLRARTRAMQKPRARSSRPAARVLCPAPPGPPPRTRQPSRRSLRWRVALTSDGSVRAPCVGPLMRVSKASWQRFRHAKGIRDGIALRTTLRGAALLRLPACGTCRWCDAHLAQRRTRTGLAAVHVLARGPCGPRRRPLLGSVPHAQTPSRPHGAPSLRPRSWSAAACKPRALRCACRLSPFSACRSSEPVS